MTSPLVRMTTEADGAAAVVALNNPSALNALNGSMIQELGRVFESLRDEPRLRAVVIRGEGKAFAAGADIRQMRSMTPEEAREYSILGSRVFEMIERFPLPVIAAVDGYALGGGLELMMSCDIVIAADGAKFGLPELTLGLVPGFGGCRRLTRRIGSARARELVFTGRIIDAATALRLCLVDHVAAPAQLMERTLALVKEISMVSPNALRTVKPILNACGEMSSSEYADVESRRFESAFRHPDAQAGMTAFLEKRKPAWREVEST